MGNFFGFDAYGAFDISTVYKPAGDFTNVGEFVSDILVFLVSAAGVIAFIFIIIAGLKFVTSSGDQKKLDSAKSTITFSVIGIAVVILSFVIIRFVQAFVGTNINLMGGGDSGSEPPPPAPYCTITPSSVLPGASVQVTSHNGLFGTIGMQGAYGTPVYSALGILPADGSTTITVPAGASAGLYVVRVGFGVGCTPNLTVNSAPVPSCSFSPATLTVGYNLTISLSNFTSGSHNVKIAGRTFGNVIDLGSVSGSSGSVAVPTTTVAPQDYDVLVNNGTDVTCSGILHVDPVPATCSFSPATLTAGGNLTLSLTDFTSGSHNVKIAGRTFGNVIDLGSVSVSGDTVTVPTTTVAPQDYDVLVNNGTDVTCSGILHVDPIPPSCSFLPATIYAGGSLTVNISYFTTGSHSVKLENMSVGTITVIGSVSGSGGTVTVPAGISAPQAYTVLVDNGIDIPCVGTLQVNRAIELTGKSYCSGFDSYVRLDWTSTTSDAQYRVDKDMSAVTLTSNKYWVSGIMTDQGATHNYRVQGTTTGINSNDVSVKNAVCIKYDAASSASAPLTASKVTWSHSTGQNSNRMLLVGVSLRGYGGSVASVFSVTYGGSPLFGGSALTKVGSYSIRHNSRVELWRLVNPASGARNIEVTLSGTGTSFITGATSWSGVHQTTPVGEFASNGANDFWTNLPSVNVASEDGEWVVDVVSTPYSLSDPIPVAGGGQTQRWNLYGPDEMRGFGSSKPGAAPSVPMSWTTKPEDWSIGAVSIKPTN